MPDKIFVNLPVKDLEATKAFFTKLGFGFNPKYTDEKAACLVISDSIFAMLITEPFFKQFTKREVADAKKTTEVLLALSVESREKVDWYATLAIEAGGKQHRETEDHGWMYARAIEDLDGHIWEVFYADENARQ